MKVEKKQEGKIQKGKNQEENPYEVLKLKNQICFPIYAVSNKIVRRYRPLLQKLDLTYTQYITMMVMWEKKQVNEKMLGKCLFLQSNTLAPLLKKLEEKGYITKEKDKNDERNLVISITEKGEKLKEQAVNVPAELASEMKLAPEKVKMLYDILYELLGEGA
ncbi:MAG: MarR family transcriptional regulator [Clostridia bacterium]|nr:MarR family transcriptional regulator [Clostridia bacterium]